MTPPPPESRSSREQDALDLLRRARATTGDDRTRLEEEVVQLHMDVARQLASSYSARGIAEDDLRQVAYLALVSAVRGFDPEVGTDFLAYAVPTIRGELRKTFRNTGWIVRPPRRLQELHAQLRQAEADLTQRLKRSPTAAELAAELDVPLDDVVEAQTVDCCFRPWSLDALVTDDGETMDPGEARGEVDPGYAASEARVILHPLIRELPERDRTIIELRFVHGYTQQQIGEEVGVSQMQVSRLLTRILGDLRASCTTGHDETEAPRGFTGGAHDRSAEVADLPTRTPATTGGLPTGSTSAARLGTDPAGAQRPIA